MSSAVKNAVLSKIAAGRAVISTGRAKYRVGDVVVHVRFCSPNAMAPGKYKFNVNPNTLSADYELWICGDAHSSFLIPISEMERIYKDPEAYVDRRHPEIRVVSVDLAAGRATYAQGGRFLVLSAYHQATL